MRVNPSDRLALEWAGVLSGVWSASVQNVLLEVGVLGVIISPIVRLMVMTVVAVIVVMIVVLYIISD